MIEDPNPAPITGCFWLAAIALLLLALGFAGGALYCHFTH